MLRAWLDARMTMLTRGADRLLELHAAELPQKDELCGCFWATLALRLHGEGPVEQDDVALLAGSVITSHGIATCCRSARPARNDFIAELPVTEDDDASGTSAHGVALRRRRAPGGRLVGAAGDRPRRAAALRALLRAAAEGTAPVVLIANVADRRVLGLAPDGGAARRLSRARRPRGRARAGLVGRALRRPRRPRARAARARS